ncbi:hypothetical protein IT397_03380 [Candidatus Nomurabacteria bacterium]|nr:hypothetical protein [Candidatus Nomurabacteria bacterium]
MKKIIVHDKMQNGYEYLLTKKEGQDFDNNFRPELTPKDMLEIGVFGGKYMTDCKDEFPTSWFKNAKLSPQKHDSNLNFFGINASHPLSVWRKNGWIDEKNDPRGWFQWYCRYYLGRRIPNEDERQIKRWRMMARHVAQVKKNCREKDLLCRRKQRQALLHWAIDSRKI